MSAAALSFAPPAQPAEGNGEFSFDARDFERVRGLIRDDRGRSALRERRREGHRQRHRHQGARDGWPRRLPDRCARPEPRAPAPPLLARHRRERRLHAREARTREADRVSAAQFDGRALVARRAVRHRVLPQRDDLFRQRDAAPRARPNSFSDEAEGADVCRPLREFHRPEGFVSAARENNLRASLCHPATKLPVHRTDTAACPPFPSTPSRVRRSRASMRSRPSRASPARRRSSSTTRSSRTTRSRYCRANTSCTTKTFRS